MKSWADIDCFLPSEFDSPGSGGSGFKFMSIDFVCKLDQARKIANTPFQITSGYRTKEYNSSLKNAVSDSSHTSGLAVDIRVSSSRERFKIVSALIKVGFHRIGVGRTFIHVDDDTSKPGEVMWDYYPKNLGAKIKALFYREHVEL